ncbi:tetratricopeptide repeat protein [uncultured Tenacibaculum sp.]|uniref:tetratricopeptide repeat protein n=1 Tax=uncultured Tenacibaculum sp. TaxID=174713 RepID=UPI002602277C|nr:tetratricopeptide repeat protein [uncultured Tenacibaculum sp.]
MSLEEDILIEKYLKNQLSEDERKGFLEQMSVDASFKEKVVFEKELFETLNENDWSFSENVNSEEVEELEAIFKSDAIKEIKESISLAQEEYKKPKKSTVKLIYLAAASVALIFTAYSLFFTVKTAPNELYAEYIQPNELYSNISRGEGDLVQSLIEGETYFKEKKYAEALPIFIKVLPSNKNTASIYLYTAICQIELDKFVEAETTLNALINSDLIDAQKGYWYKSLLFIKSKQIEKAKKQLEFIIENNYFKYQKAEELLTKLD